MSYSRLDEGAQREICQEMTDLVDTYATEGPIFGIESQSTLDIQIQNIWQYHDIPVAFLLKQLWG